MYIYIYIYIHRPAGRLSGRPDWWICIQFGFLGGRNLCIFIGPVCRPTGWYVHIPVPYTWIGATIRVQGAGPNSWGLLVKDEVEESRQHHLYRCCLAGDGKMPNKCMMENLLRGPPTGPPGQ